MKKKIFIGVFIGVHIIFVILQIHKQALFISLSYQKQRYEKKLQQLQEHANMLTSKLCTLQNQHDVKEYAQETLNMKKIHIDQIRKVTHEKNA